MDRKKRYHSWQKRSWILKRYETDLHRKEKGLLMQSSFLKNPAHSINDFRLTTER